MPGDRNVCRGECRRRSVVKQAVGGRPPRYAAAPPPPWAPKRSAQPSRRQRSSSFPRPTRSHAHRCSRLTRQHGVEQRGLVTLTFDLESCVRVKCDVGYLCTKFGLPGPLYSRLRPMPDVRDIQTSDVRQTSKLKRQTKASLNVPAYWGRGLPLGRGHKNIGVRVSEVGLQWNLSTASGCHTLYSTVL